MLKYPDIDPIAFSLGPIQVHWYGIMYIFAFTIGWILGRYRASQVGSGWTKDEVDDLVTWVMLGAILGGRLGYVFFYDFAYYMHDPIKILYVWKGGMSFHGGLIGILLILYWWGKKHHKATLDVFDFVVPTGVPGLFFGRMGNFINGELWGKVTTMPFGMVFPHAGSLPRHPVQLYEGFCEGIILFIILWTFSKKERVDGAVSGLFGVCYGSFRIFNEFFREPDAHIGYLYGGWLTMGILLSIPLIVAGAILLLRASILEKNPQREKVVLPDGSIVWVKRQ